MIEAILNASKVTTGSPTKKLILMILADHVNQDGECWPSHSRLARICEVSKSAIVRNLNQLEESGLLTKKHRFVKGNKTSNIYTLNLQPLVAQSYHPSSAGLPPLVAQSFIEPVTLEPVIEPRDIILKFFEVCWSEYGKKGNRKTSLKRFLKLSKENRLLMSDHIKNYVLATPDKQYRKNFETYINQECWFDEVDESVKSEANPYDYCL